MEEKIYSVYMHTNKTNNKRYIGMTSLLPEKRWAGGHGYYRQPDFWNDIVEFGWNGFSHEILFDGLSKEEAQKKEKELISLYETENPEKGYNRSGAFHIKKAESKPGIQRAVHCIELDTIYDNACQAGRALHLNNSHISGACRGDRKSCGGYHWEYIEVAI